MRSTVRAQARGACRTVDVHDRDMPSRRSSARTSNGGKLRRAVSIRIQLAERDYAAAARGYEGSLPVTLIEYLLLPSAGRRDDIGCGSSEADRGDGKCIVWQKFTIADDFRQNCSRSHHDLPVTHPEQLKDHWDGSESKEIVVDHFLN